MPYDERPNYSRIRKMFVKMADYAVKHETKKFDWDGTGYPLWHPRLQEDLQDMSVQARLLTHHVDELGEDIRRFGRNEEDVARVWSNACKKVLEYKDEVSGHLGWRMT